MQKPFFSTNNENMKSLTKVITNNLSVFLDGRITVEKASLDSNQRIPFEEGRVFSADTVENGREHEQNSSPAGVILK